MNVTKAETAPWAVEMGNIAPKGSLAVFVEQLAAKRESSWAWDNVKGTIAHLATLSGGRRALEIGGGRDPLFTPAEAQDLGLDLTINDISAEELRHAPAAFAKARFDISEELAGADVPPGGFDLAFSRMVFEHVRDGRRAWANMHALLAPGGIAFAFIPTLYALPFVVNRVMPEALSSALVRVLYPHRTADEDPKFPAYYSLCVARRAIMEPALRAAGFREVHIVPFYGHGYFDRLPVFREIDRAFNGLAARRDWTFWASYAFIIARK